MGFFNRKSSNHTPQEFQAEILKIFVDKATKKHYLAGSLIFVPEIIQAGGNYTLSWLRNSGFQARFNGDAINYYFNLSNFCFFAGAYYAYMWHHDFDAFQNENLEQKLYLDGVQATASPIMPIKRSEAEAFCKELFEEYIRLVQPHQDQPDAPRYTFNGLNTFFTIGASIQLKSMGFD